MRGIWGQLKQDLRDPVFVVSVTILASFLAMSGPFGSYLSMTVAERLAFWFPVSFGGAIFGLIVDALARNRFGPEGETRSALIVALLAAIIAAWPLYALIYSFIAPSRTGMVDLLETGLLIFFAHLSIGSLRKVWSHAFQTRQSPALTAPDPNRLPPFAGRLAADILAPVAVISGRDHRIEVTTDRGSASLFMRFSDAVSQMDPAAGMQVHRSHWVSFRRMHCMEKIGQRHFLILDSGDRVPISKQNVDTVRQYLNLPRLGDVTGPMPQAAE